MKTSIAILQSAEYTSDHKKESKDSSTSMKFKSNSSLDKHLNEELTDFTQKLYEQIEIQVSAISETNKNANFFEMQ
jgi:hypothetical protein